ncbi:MAG: hypothetical protein IMF19_10425 [Proteobacteria bacterium]|nr:hypothetical protein [Pseudomonadota bacterium]
MYKKISQLQEQIRNIKAAEKKEIDYKKIFDNIEAFCEAVKRGIENASFEEKRRIFELLVDEVIVTNGKVEINHIIPLEKKGNLQLHGRDLLQRREELLVFKQIAQQKDIESINSFVTKMREKMDILEAICLSH